PLRSPAASGNLGRKVLVSPTGGCPMSRNRSRALTAVFFGCGLAAGLLVNRLGPGGSPRPASAAQGGKEPARRSSPPADDGKLRVICFGAPPDDCELKAGGAAALWAAQGHHVKFVSVTNGDIGHWRQAGGPLARRRGAEVRRAARVLGITTQVLDIHDG